jgi:hypothetical protein
MRRTAVRVALLCATLALAGCTPFFYGGVVVFGPAEDQAPAKEGKGQAVP